MTTRLTTAQADLVATNHDLASMLAVRARGRWPHGDPAAILSDAFLGLIDAAGRWDPAGRAAFRTFARPRVWGAIIDGYRDQHGKRGGKRLHPFPVDDDGEVIESVLAHDELGFDRVNDAVAAASIVARMPALTGGGGRATVDSVVTLIGSGLSNTEIADVLGVSQSRISQVVRRAGEAAVGPWVGRRPTCAGCRLAFWPRQDGQRYCTAECKAQGSARARREGLVRPAALNCALCRAMFRPRPGGGAMPKFCSRECRLTVHRRKWAERQRTLRLERKVSA